MPHTLLIAVFPSRDALNTAALAIKADEEIKLERAAIIAKAQNGETLILEDDLSADEGAIAGGVLGAAMAAMGVVVNFAALSFPPLGSFVLIGASALVGGFIGNATGRFAAHLLDLGYKDEQLDELASQLEKGHVALVMEVDEPANAMTQLQSTLAGHPVEWLRPV